jgi:uncharacterized protein
MNQAVVAGLIGCVSFLYAMVGQAGGTAFLAIMALAEFSPAEMRPTALLLNIVAATYATWRLHRRRVVEWKLLVPITAPSIATAFLGGLLVLRGSVYFVTTGLLLIAAAGLMLLHQNADVSPAHPVRPLPAAVAGGAAGLLSGLIGIGGGVFLTPLLVAFGWASPKRAARLSPAFILCNSIVGFVGVLVAGQRVASGTVVYAVAAFVGAILGTTASLRWMSEKPTRYVLAAILLFAGMRLLFR